MATYINTLVQTSGGDLARPTKFRAYFTLPIELSRFAFSGGYVQERDLDLLCKSFTIPQRKMEVIDYKLKGKTVPIMGPVDVVHNVSVTFLLDEAHKIRTLFDNWILSTQSRVEETANKTINSYQQTVPLWHDRTSTILLTPLNWQEDLELKYYKFSGAYPTSVGDVQYSSDSVSSTQELTVEFAFVFLTDEDGSSDILDDITGVANNGLLSAKEFLSSGAQDLVNSFISGERTSSVSGYSDKKSVPVKDVNDN